MSLQLIKDHTNLARDTETGAIVNIDQNAYQASLERHYKAQKQKETIENNSRDINTIKTELTEIKSMLKLLLEGKQNDG